MHALIHYQTAIQTTPRVLILNGLFDVPPAQSQTLTWEVHLPLEDRDWSIGLICGPSGSGKSTIARHCFPEACRDQHSYPWRDDHAIVDGFPDSLSMQEITGLLCSVGFASPPSWLRPFGKLSTGEQFRVTIARTLAERLPLTICDEFTSTVDRNVAQIASHAIQKAVRERGQRFIAVTCHGDVADWLLPDWTYDPSANQFAWRSLRQRPPIVLTVQRTTTAEWRRFRHHHYLNTAIHPAAQCFIACWRGHSVAFSSWITHVVKSGQTARREHRTVVLPDFQGVGIGSAMSNFCAALCKRAGHQVFSTTSHPALLRHRHGSELWACLRYPQLGRPTRSGKHVVPRHSTLRLTTSFAYVGPPAHPLHAKVLL